MITITDFLTRHSVPFAHAGENHHVRRNWIGLEHCPFCGHGGYHLGIHLSWHYVHCWSCGRHGLIETLYKATNIPYGVLKASLGLLHKSPPEARITQAGRFKPPPGVEPLLRPHRRYLIDDRGLDPDEIVRIWNIGGLGILGNLKWRIYIPVFLNGRTVSWTTRAIETSSGTSRRYVSADASNETVPIHDVLYGADMARHSIIITEGPVDAWAIGPGAVATFGTSFTPAQIARMAAFPLRVVLFDNEPSAQKSAKRLYEALSTYQGVTRRVILESGKDAAEACPGEIAELREKFLSPV